HKNGLWCVQRHRPFKDARAGCYCGGAGARSKVVAVSGKDWYGASFSEYVPSKKMFADGSPTPSSMPLPRAIALRKIFWPWIRKGKGGAIRVKRRFLPW